MVATANKHFAERAVRQERKRMANAVRNGFNNLVVFGNQTDGYRLGGERAESVVLFGPTHKRQGEAIAHGQEHFGQTAKRVTKGKARKAA